MRRIGIFGVIGGLWLAAFAISPALSQSLDASKSPATSKDPVVMNTSERLPLKAHVGGVVTSHMAQWGTDAKPSVAWSYQWPAIYFESRFDGTHAKIILDDGANTLSLIVDGEELITFRHFRNLEYDLAYLKPGPHTVRLEKITESQYGTGVFGGVFIYGDSKPLPAPTYSRRMEFIGDSFTAGYGNTWTKGGGCEQATVDMTTDTQKAWPVLLAKALNADYRVQAFSGIGVVRNYDGREHDKYRMPSIYNKALFDDPAPQPADYKPQVMVFALGGNDFSTDLHAGEKWKTRDALRADFEASYATFIKARRVENPDARFLILAYEPSTTEEGSEIEKVYQALKSAGDPHLDFVSLPPQKRTGCNGHLDLDDEAMIAGVLKAHLDAIDGLWPSDGAGH